MTRKTISALLALVLCFSLAVSVSAVETGFVIDEQGYLAAEEVNSLNALASELYGRTGVGIFFAYVHGDSAENYDISAIVGSVTDYVVMVETDKYWFVHKGGRGEVITYDDEDAIRAIYNETRTYVDGVEAYLKATAEYFPELPAATEPVAYSGEECFLYDGADLLTDGEEGKLTAQLEEISHTCNTQLVIYTMASMEGKNIDTFVDELYDSMGFGYGENHEGVLLLISMNPREYRILSNGYAGEAVGTDEIDKLCDIMDTYLPNGYYTTAFSTFAEQCGEFLAYYQAGSPFEAGKNLAISIVIGLIVGLIVAFVLKGQLKSVHKQKQANVYVKQGSMTVDIRQDIFLYRNITRTRKQKESSSGSSGSGGSTRSKGGGSF